MMIPSLTFLLLVTVCLGGTTNNLTEFYTTQFGRKAGFNAFSGMFSEI